MDSRQQLLNRSRVHPQWRPLLLEALQQLEDDYIERLLRDANWLPGLDRLFAAFRRDAENVRYILIGESPYPRKESANGIAFFDAAVTDLWSQNGLSKAVNRATSMRNILKTALQAEGLVHADAEGKISQQQIAQVDKTGLIQNMEALFDNLHRRGFLMLNATPVLHQQRKPAKEALYWKGFLDKILELLAEMVPRTATMVLWGKIAEAIEDLPASNSYQRLKCEHPYNISFIQNPLMRNLFSEHALLKA